MDKLITHVEFKLHETFRNPLRKVAMKPGTSEICLGMIGWGTFEVPMTIHFKKELCIPAMQVEHHLSFDTNAGGKWKTVMTQINKVSL